MGFIVARDLDAALKAAEPLDPRGRADILSLVAKHTRLAGNRTSAESLFRRALEDAERFRTEPLAKQEPRPGHAAPVGRPQDQETQHKTDVLVLLATIHARAGVWDSATRELAAIPDEGKRKGVTALRMAAMRAHSGDFVGALAWARSLPSPSLRTWAIRGMAFGIYNETAGQF
jgi:hypothetical protein